jgi:hypothetical protein
MGLSYDYKSLGLILEAKLLFRFLLFSILLFKLENWNVLHWLRPHLSHHLIGFLAAIVEDSDQNLEYSSFYRA